MIKQKESLPLIVTSGLAAVLTLVAASSGLLIPGFYEPFLPTTSLLAGAHGQDLIAVAVALLLLAALALAWRGSARALPVWAGFLSFLIYAYLLWTLEAIYSFLFPAYLAIASLSLFSLIGLLGKLDATAFRNYVADGMPVRSTAAILALPALMAPPWVTFVLQGVAAGEPASINTVLVLDLTVIIPASIVTAVLLWRRRTWGFIFAGVFLVKMLTMSSALVISTLWGAILGVAIDPVLPLYALMTVLGGVAMVRYLQHIRATARATTPAAPVGAD